MKNETGPQDVDVYLKAVPSDARATLQQLREAIRSAAPEATEHISYDMPTFKIDGRFLVSYAAWKNHCSLYPVSAASLQAIGEDPAEYDVNDKGTLRFPPTKPPSRKVVEKLVKARLAEEQARSN